MNKQHIVDQLNKLLAIDKSLLEKLVETRYPVSEEYTQADAFVYIQETDEATPVAGFIGVLNGLLEQDGVRIAANYEDDAATNLTGFVLVTFQ